MKSNKSLFILLILIIGLSSAAQVGINEDGSSPDPSAIFDVKSNNKGFLVPRMTQVEIEAINSPADGLLVFNSDNSRFYFFDGQANEWKEIAIGVGTLYPPTTVAEVLNPVTGRTWMDRNLGALQVATSSTDTAAYGDLYQWGRLADGHEDRASIITPTLSTADSPGHDNFIVTNVSPFDWRSPQNDSLWQGVSGINNPCPDGFRLPTSAEWEEERQSWSSNDAAGAFTSPLKLTSGGWRHHANGTPANVDSEARYWSSTKNGTGSDALGFSDTDALVSGGIHAYGFTVRCIKDEPATNQPPDPPSNPSPADAATDEPVTASLAWSFSDPDGDTLTFDVYFGDTSPPALVSQGQADSTYDPGTLSDSTTYYWMIVAHDDSDTTAGPGWSFTTAIPPAPWACGDSLLDTRDSMRYATVLIDSVCWMAENLAHLPSVNAPASGNNTDPYYYVYGYDGTDTAAAKATSNYQNFGVLYNWVAATTACPPGWHTPTDAEWKTLEGNTDSNYPAGDAEWDQNDYRGFDVCKNLKSTTGWNSGGNGLDLYGFTALPAGGRSPSGNFYGQGGGGRFWTATEGSADHAWYRILFFDTDSSYRANWTKGLGYSVRCVEGDAPANQPPSPPHYFNPENGAVDQSVDTTVLSWISSDPDGDPVTFDVYFDTVNPPAQVATGQSAMSYDPGTLNYSTQYFWHIVAHDEQGNSTNGALLSFTTQGAPVSFSCGDSLFDARDSMLYATVQIGNQCWMAENLAYLPSVSTQATQSLTVPHYYVFGYDGTDVAAAKATTNYQTSGVLYNWPAVMNGEDSSSTVPSGVQGVCPTGWHVPSDEEWKILEGAVDSQYGYPDPVWDGLSFRGYDAGGNLKETGTTHWPAPNTGATNNSGFTALPNGMLNYGSGFSYSTIGFFWTTTQPGPVFRYVTTSSSQVMRNNNYSNGHGLGIRCVSNTPPPNQPPAAPSNPTPADSSENQATTTTLSWSCSDPENDTLNYDVYFGTTSPPAMVSSGQAGTTYDPGTLNDSTTYYWMITAHDGVDSTDGPEWSFTTASPAPWACGDSLFDSRDSTMYATVLIDTVCWMAENLNIGTSINSTTSLQSNNGTIEKYCYDNVDAYCDTNGGLYQWDEMMQYTTTENTQGICPDGWILPSDNDWKILEGNVDSQYGVGDPEWDQFNLYRGYDVGDNLKSTTGWASSGNGNDSFGFTALPAGYMDGTFTQITTATKFWSSTIFNELNGWVRTMYHGSSKVWRGEGLYGNAFSVRCVKYVTLPNQAPDPPSNPSPADTASGQPATSTLSWSGSDPDGDTLTYDVYFGDTSPPALVSSNQADTTYDPGTLNDSTTYYWMITAHDGVDSTDGPEWSFTTAAPASWACGDSLLDTRDGTYYATVLIDSLCWMAENLAYLPSVNLSSNQSATDPRYYVYNYSGADPNAAKATSEYQNYGALYNWPASMNACPDGWHLATDSEWTDLSDYLGGLSVAGGKLKSTRTDPDAHPRWDSPNTGATDSEGFSAYPGGRVYSGVFQYQGSYGYHWTATEVTPGGPSSVYTRHIYYHVSSLHPQTEPKNGGNSVRCVRDMPPQNQAPDPPSNPSPADAATDEPVTTTLAWSFSDPDGDTLTFDVYFGDTSPPVLVSQGQADSTYDPGTLNDSTTYYWMITTHDGMDSTDGPEWSFTTAAPAPWTCGDSLFDSRDNTYYATVLIDTMCWMAENLNVGTSIGSSSSQTNNAVIEKYCYDNNVSNCDSSGGLYQWDEMMQYTTTENTQGICPDGWFLPSDNDWKTLEGLVDSQFGVGDPEWDLFQVYRGNDVGDHLKSTTGWSSSGNGTDPYGFTALPAGYKQYFSTFAHLTTATLFWSSTIFTADKAYARTLGFENSDAYRGDSYFVYGLSVRCLKAD